MPRILSGSLARHCIPDAGKFPAWLPASRRRSSFQRARRHSHSGRRDAGATRLRCYL